MLVISVVVGIAMIFGSVVTFAYLWWNSVIEYKVDQEFNDDRIFYHE